MVLSKLLDDPARQRVDRDSLGSLNFIQIVPLAYTVGAQHQSISREKRFALDFRGADRLAEHARLPDQCSTTRPENLAVSVSDLYERENLAFGVQEAGDNYRARTVL